MVAISLYQKAKAWLPILKMIAFTTVATYPFLAVVLSHDANKQREHLRPCDDECTFIRYWSSGGLPATTWSHLHSETENTPAHSGRIGLWLHWVFQPMTKFSFPQYVHVRNGHNITSSSFFTKWWPIDEPLSWPFLRLGFVHLSLLSLVGVYKDAAVGNQEMYASPICRVHNVSCKDTIMTSHIHDHLSGSTAERMYLVGLSGWWLLKIVHDYQLLNNRSEYTTLKIGVCSLWFQMLACVSGYAWSIGAMETFKATHPQNECTCYYELPAITAFLSLVSLVLLQSITHNKIASVLASIQHGDYLYFTQYDVPFRAVRAARPTNPTASLIVGSIAGGKNQHMDDMDVTFSQLQILNRKMLKIFKCWNFMSILIGVFVPGPFLLRTMREARSEDSFWWASHVTLGFVAIASIGNTIYMVMERRLPSLLSFWHGKNSWEHWNKCLWLLDDLGVLVGAYFLGAWTFFGWLRSDWSWFLVGHYMYVSWFQASSLQTHLPQCEALQMRVLQLTGSPVDWKKFADNNPHQCLDSQQALRESFEQNVTPDHPKIEHAKLDQFLKKKAEQCAKDKRPHVLVAAELQADEYVPLLS